MQKKKTVLVKLLKEVVMLNFYDCDKNLSENDFNEVEKKTRSIYSIFIQVTLLQMEFFVKYGLKLEQVK